MADPWEDNIFVSTNPALNVYAENTTAWPSSPYNPANTSTGGGTPPATGGGAYPADKYIGWDPESAQQDWNAKQGQVLGASTGDGQPGVPGMPSDAQVRSDIEAAYDPIFETLSRRAGLLPEEQASLEKQITDLEKYQRGEAETGRKAELTGLGESERLEGQKSKRTLDEFSTDLADLLRKIGGIYGGSSGAEAVGAAVGKQATRTRGSLIEARDNALRTIDLKKRAVDSTYQSEMRKVDMWKSSQLASISQQIQKQLEEINTMKDTASSQKAQQLADLSSKMYFNTVSYLQNLDLMVREYKASMDSWKERVGVEFEDFEKRLKATGQYKGSGYQQPAAPTLATATDTYAPQESTAYGTGGEGGGTPWDDIYQGYGQVGIGAVGP